MSNAVDKDGFHGIYDRWIQCNRATKKKPATLLIEIPDSLAEELIKQHFGGLLADVVIRGLALHWREVREEVAS